MTLMTIGDYWRSIGMRPGIQPVPDDACPECGGHKVVYAPTGKTYETANGDEEAIRKIQPCPVCCADVCPICGDLGVVTASNAPVGHPAFGKFFPCPARCRAAQALAAQQFAALVEYSRLPEEYESCTFERFKAWPAAKREGKMPAYYAARSFVKAADRGYWVNRAQIAAKFNQNDAPDDLRNWLVFWGQHGRGKTGMAASIVHALREQSKKVTYIRLQDMIEAVQKRYGPEDYPNGYDDEYGDMTAAQVIDHFKQSDVLVVDEFGVPDIRENKLAIAEKLIRYRHGHLLPTIITTNHSQGSFEGDWGPVIYSVIKQRAHWIEVRGVDLRDEPQAFNWE